ncbi:MAG: SCP2 sterol-binding domain-containing protein [Sciscionella sp.]|nr:SCP2 sterol-binding domain-containing protein [Sciscionella sp.]
MAEPTFGIGSDLSSLGELEPGQVITLLEGLDPGDEGIADVDINDLAEALDPTRFSNTEFVRVLSAINTLADGGADLDLSKMDPDNFARLISRASKEHINAIVNEPRLRQRIFDEIFSRMRRHYRSERARSINAVVHWRISGGSGEGGYDRYESVLADGECRVNREMTGKPRATITVGPADFMRIITRNVAPPVLFMTGKLRVRGDLAFAAGLMNLFDLPSA